LIVTYPPSDMTGGCAAIVCRNVFTCNTCSYVNGVSYPEEITQTDDGLWSSGLRRNLVYLSISQPGVRKLCLSPGIE
jgi:hypothetical protein